MAADLKQWGIDYLKYDWNPLDYYHVKEMHDALRTLDRDVVYSLSNSAPYGDAPQWMRYSNCWRTTGDIRDTWESISTIGFSQDRWLPFNRPGHWADPDMLVIGMVGWGPKLHYTQLTADEQYTHISLWSLLAAPLLIGCDMAQMDDFTRSLLTNDEVIDVNQDPLGLQAVPVWQQGDQVIYAKHLDGRRAFQPGLADREDELHAPHAGSARQADRARPVAAEGPHGVHRQVRNRRCASRRRSGESLPRQQPRTGDRQIARPCFIINKRRIPAYPSFS